MPEKIAFVRLLTTKALGSPAHDTYGSAQQAMSGSASTTAIKTKKINNNDNKDASES